MSLKSYDNVGKNENSNFVSGKNKLEEKISNKCKKSGQNHIAQKKTISKQLKGTNGKICFIRNRERFKI